MRHELDALDFLTGLEAMERISDGESLEAAIANSVANAKVAAELGPISYAEVAARVQDAASRHNIPLSRLFSDRS